MPPTPENALNKSQPIYIVLGSGGHTAEMCKINQAMLKSPASKDMLPLSVRYLVAQSDITSRQKLQTVMQLEGVSIAAEAFMEMPRSREVGQSWLTTFFTTLWALVWSFYLVWRDRPRLVLCNGPGTCVPICVSTYLWRLLGRLTKETKIVYVESFCRVQTLSMSGRLIMPLADMFVVQWLPLAERYKHKKNVRYFGNMM